jgi:hypothetical protein
MSIGLSAALSALLVVAAAACACSDGGPPTAGVSAGDSGAQPPGEALVDRVRTLAGSAKSVDEVAERAGSYVTGLSNSDKLLLGKALVDQAQPPFDVFGASILVSVGEEQVAGPVFARFVVSGGDMTGFFFSWMHGADSRTASRMYIAIAEDLLSQFDMLTEPQRDRARQFLTAEGLGPPITAFSEQAVRDRIEYLKREVESSRPPR